MKKDNIRGEVNSFLIQIQLINDQTVYCRYSTTIYRQSQSMSIRRRSVKSRMEPARHSAIWLAFAIPSRRLVERIRTGRINGNLRQRPRTDRS